ncbi:MAG: hypothetical protein M3Z05_14480 [Gemmatimonadota bacterium]|nr:hypothetical protein [Gemmatimonadota bacterium]
MILALAVAFLPVVARAQIAHGDRVRVNLGARRIADGIFLGTDSLHNAVVVSGLDTSRVQFYGGYSAERFVPRQAAGRTILNSVGVGVGIGVGILGAARLTGTGGENNNLFGLKLIVGVLATATGYVAGTIMAMVRHDEWQSVSFTPSDYAGVGCCDAATRTTGDGGG